MDQELLFGFVLSRRSKAVLLTIEPAPVVVFVPAGFLNVFPRGEGEGDRSKGHRSGILVGPWASHELCGLVLYKCGENGAGDIGEDRLA